MSEETRLSPDQGINHVQITEDGEYFYSFYFLLSSAVNNIARVFCNDLCQCRNSNVISQFVCLIFNEQLVMEIYLWKWATQPELPAQ